MQNLTIDAITTSNTIPAESSQIQAINFPNFQGKICGETRASYEETHRKREKADSEKGMPLTVRRERGFKIKKGKYVRVNKESNINGEEESKGLLYKEIERWKKQQQEMLNQERASSLSNQSTFNN
ncbi:hypothetical protein WN943_023839 [Citrus x changshan-huyou]